MSEDKIDQATEDTEIAEEQQSSPTPPRRFLTKRKLGITFGGLAVILGFLLLLLVGSYRYGYFDSYIKAQFVAKMADIGVVFDADVFRVAVAPLRLELKNATFNDKVSGDKLFFIREANLDLTVENLYAWQLTRDIQINKTELRGVEAWVKFDENGKSNFSNLNFVEDQAGSRVNFKYDSIVFSLQDGLVNFGDVQHKISADAKNVVFTLEPTTYAVPDEQKRYQVFVSSTNSKFIYDEKPIEPINISARGIADNRGADISELKINTPLGETSMNGKLTDWERLQYDLKITSSVDLQKTASVLPTGATLRGIGNFEGNVTGEGAKYQVNGEINSDSLAADNVYLKGLRINGNVQGENAIYEGNGKAIAELLTFGDFRIDLPQLVGNIRGNGTDFKWFGELRAAAAESPDGTLSGLFISDAVAEYKEKRFTANFGGLRANRFASRDILAENLQTGTISVNSNNGVTVVNAPNVRAGVVKAEGTELRGVNANGIKVTNSGSKTEAQINNLKAENLRTKDASLRNVTANGVNLTNQNGATDIQARNVQADGVDADGVKVNNLTAGNVNVKVRGNQTDVESGTLKIARVETNAAILADLNIAGVRLTIREGRIEGESNDFDAGNVDLKGQGRIENAKVFGPRFVLEPVGRYRASLDLSLGSGVLGSIKLGAARASVEADNDKVTLNKLKAAVMGGNVNEHAVIAMSDRGQSKFDAEFVNLDLAKILALQGGRVLPIEGNTTGKANLTFYGTNFKRASGTLVADFNANAGTTDRGLVPVNGNLGLRATDGLFDIDYANLNTEKSKLTATGRFDLNGENSNLVLGLDSSDATEIDRLVRVLDLSPELTQQLADNQVNFAGKLTFEGTLTRNLKDPDILGSISLESLKMRDRDLGSLNTKISVSRDLIELGRKAPEEINRNDLEKLGRGILQEKGGGGSTEFIVKIPRTGTNNIEVTAELKGVNTGNLLAALPIEKYLPEKVRDFDAKTSGTIELTGLPKAASGFARLKSGAGTVAGQPFDGMEANVTFQGTEVKVENFEARLAGGYLKGNGTYDREKASFNFKDIEGKNLQIASLIPLLTNNKDLPAMSGTINLTEATATGTSDQFSTYNINFKGVGQNVIINGNSVGTVNFDGQTVNQLLTAKLTANLQGQQQVISASVNFAENNLPFKAETNFNQTELAPFIALLRSLDSVPITGRATGKVLAEGNLYARDNNGKGYFTTDYIKGTAQFSEFSLLFDETPFNATQPISITFNSQEVTVDNARFAGGGSNLVVNGTKAIGSSGINNLTIDGKINLRLLNLASQNSFFSGLADVSVRLTGLNEVSRLTGSASTENASISTFVGSERLNFERLQTRILFNSNQAQIERAVGYLGGGKVVGTGGAEVEGLKLKQFRLALNGQNITAPIPKDFLTTGDVEVNVTGKCELDEREKCKAGGNFATRIEGTIYTRRSLYTKDIDFADLISGRREAPIARGGGGPTVFGTINLDLRLQGRDALVVRNNLADLTASVDLRVTGDVDFPVISGRVTANSGTVFFRSDRYTLNRGTVEFPPQLNGDPVVNLQAESEINGYQVFVNLNGELSNLDALQATVRSNPALPQADVISLITTGSLSNSEGGITTTGLNTAAEVITDTLINAPIRKATDKLFGLNKFEIDPILSGRRLNPTARLTVGRQINKNLAVTYSTNLSEDQNQVLALEYRVSNRLSFVAQYEQGSLSNVTRSNNNFSFEIRLRKRF